MRKRRGLIFMLVGVVLAAASAFLVMNLARQAAQPPKTAQVVQPEPIKKVYVVVAEKDVPENVALSAQDLVTKEFPADFVPAGAVAGPEYAVGKYTTSRIYKGQILVAPLIADARKSSQLSAKVPEGKVALAVNVTDAMNNLGALRAGDKVDVLLTLDMKNALPQDKNSQAAQQQGQDQAPQQKLATQVTMQNVEILQVGAPAGDTPTNAAGQPQTQVQANQQASKTITFLLDHQDAITLKFVKDSGGTMDLVVRNPEDKKLAKTEAVTVDTLYKQFRFRFPEPIKQ